MKFSVIIPLYNKVPYVRKALESVFAQTYTDYELIVIDDGSTDDSARIAEECIREVIGYRLEVKGERLKAKGSENGEADSPASRLSPLASRLRLLSQPNAGVSAARNNGVAASQGDYVAFLDADDWWEPTYLERMAQLIADYPDAGLYACNYVYYKPGKTHVALKNIETGYINYPKTYYEEGVMPVTSISVAIPREVYDKMGGFPLSIKLGEDFLLWSKIALQYPVAFLNEPLAWYNNDVPATLRATRNIHAPEHHMLFRLDECKVESVKCKCNEDGEADSPTSRLLPLASRQEDWHNLLDRLRVTGLMDYWLSDEYHDQVAEELKKVDWSKQPISVIRMYKTSIWMLKLKRCVMRVGSFGKQFLIKTIKIK